MHRVHIVDLKKLRVNDRPRRKLTDPGAAKLSPRVSNFARKRHAASCILNALNLYLEGGRDGTKRPPTQIAWKLGSPAPESLFMNFLPLSLSLSVAAESRTCSPSFPPSPLPASIRRAVFYGRDSSIPLLPSLSFPLSLSLSLSPSRPRRPFGAFISVRRMSSSSSSAPSISRFPISLRLVEEGREGGPPTGRVETRGDGHCGKGLQV